MRKSDKGAGIEKEQLIEIKRKAGVEIYEERLRRFHAEGKGYKALCPFHDDTNPSLKVYRGLEGIWLWKCFACDVGGDVFELVKRLDKVTFPEAVRRVAEKIGFEMATKELPEFKFDPAEATARLPEIEKFLANRGIDLKTAELYKVGAAEIPGLGRAVVMPYGETGAAKIRAVEPQKGRKFRHLPGRPTADLLYGIEKLDDWTLDFSDYVIITESELDCLTLVSFGFTAVSVSSATVVTGRDGELKLNSEHLAKLEGANKIILAFDQDEAGQRCTEVFERFLPEHTTYRLAWPYKKGTPGAVKDVGDLYQQNPETFRERFNGLISEALNRPPVWRSLFRSYSEMESGEIQFLAKGIIPEGITFLGGAPGSGKSWMALSLAKALVTGRNFLGAYETPEPQNVLYLIPEAGEKSFRKRMETIRITDNTRFLCRTARQGILALNDPMLLKAVAELKPVIFLDTTIRFLSGTDENDAGQIAKNLGDMLIGLRQAGAPAIIGLHHATKADGKKVTPKLESVLRGSGDIAALADAVYGLKCTDTSNLTVMVYCVKARDFEQPGPFTMQGRPYLNERGDLILLADAFQKELETLNNAILANPRTSARELERITGIGRNRVPVMANNLGWQRKGSVWVREDKNMVLPTGRIM